MNLDNSVTNKYDPVEDNGWPRSAVIVERAGWDGCRGVGAPIGGNTPAKVVPAFSIIFLNR